MGKRNFAIGLLLCCFCFLDAQENDKSLFEWEIFDSLPPRAKDSIQPGLAGAFSGMHEDAMIIAGGANFPDLPPWKGGQKKWYDVIHVYQNGAWLSQQFQLQRPLAYGQSISTEDGLICIGGCDANQCYPDVFLLSWNEALQQIVQIELPPLPVPLGFMAGALVDDVIYVAGGQETMQKSSAKDHFFALDLSRWDDGERFRWESLPSWGGAPRILPVAVAQSDGLDNCFFLFSGRNVQPNEATQYLSDSYRYNPIKGSWKKLGPILDQRCIMGATAVAQGAGHIFVFGGDDGRLASESKKLSQLIAKLERQRESIYSEKQILEDTGINIKLGQAQLQKEQLFETHPGFSQDLLSYYSITDSWHVVDRLPIQSRVTTNAFRWGESIIIPSGEVSPGKRSPDILKLIPIAEDNSFGTLNYLVLFLYFISLLWIGWYFSKRQKSTEDYFKGGGRVPWWAAGLSIFGTVLSAITFMAIPAKTFATDWSYLMYNFSPFFIAPIIISLFLPFFHKLNLTTAYEYLERRFNLAARLLGSISFMLYQLGRVGIVMYLPAIALNIVTSFPILWCIILMGVISVIYTMMGGIEGVIWTDVLQVVVLMGGAILCLGLIVSSIEGGLGGAFQLTLEENKYNILDFTFDWKQPSFWVVLLGGIFSNIVFYGTDQTVVQRYMTAKDIKSSSKSVWTNAILVLPATLLFFAIGTLLFVFYKKMPEQLQAGLEATDAIFPWYIISELPQGFSGLLIAGVFAAAMSSLSSSMNSVATAYTTDFHQRFGWLGEPLKVARWSTLITGILGTLFALLMATSDIKSLWDEFIKVVGLFTGGLGGLFVLGMLSKRANGRGALIGLAFSAVIQYWVVASDSIHLMLFTATGFFSCIVMGYLASLFFRDPA